MNEPNHARSPHASMDLQARARKALKIERLLDLAHRAQPISLLEIGTGSGGIAHYFATHPTLRCTVEAVDVCDNRVQRDAYGFQLVHDTQLPFAAAAFDVVISNHVIEHVGDRAAQHRHLAEIRRVLKPTGTGYLAVPNRWMLTEPHFHLKFLSWLPHAWRTPYLRWRHRGEFYDVEPLEKRELERMLQAAGFAYRNLCVEAWRQTLEIERPSALATRVLRTTPDALLRPLRGIIPTLIYRVTQV